MRWMVLVCLFLTPMGVFAEYEEVFPSEADPLVGDWSGRWTSGETVDPAIHAQIVALGNDRYRIRLVPMLDMRCPPRLETEVTAVDGVLTFREGGYFGEARGTTFTGGRGSNSAFTMEKVTRLPRSLGAAPPAGAVVLFDGTGFDAWETPEGWDLLEGGVMMVKPKAKYLVSKQRFKDLRMHIEFRTPFMPRARGQQRGNSGVFIQDVYEVQVLDSYGLEGYYDDCGALYKVAAPKVNATAPPLQWQTYEIEYRAPRHDEAGNQTVDPYMTVRHNGVLIHYKQEIPWITAWTEEGRLSPAPRDPGSIRLQPHGNYVQFRNIWVEDLGESLPAK